MTPTTLKRTLLATALGGALLAPAAFAAPPATEQVPASEQTQAEPADLNKDAAKQAVPTPVETTMPYEKADGAWVAISGTVEKPTEGAFQLNYGTGTIIVEMDTWEGWTETMGLKEGDEVLVTGEIDKDIFETASIEAGAVYDQTKDTHYFASKDDEEDLVAWANGPAMTPGMTTIRGAITQVNAGQGEFILNNGIVEMQVDIGKLENNPLDAEGDLVLALGDIVMVSGVIEKNLFEDREIQATTLTRVGDTTQRAAAPDATKQTAEAAVETDAFHAGIETAVETAEVKLPAEVQEVVDEGSYTTEDLVKAQLAALENDRTTGPS